MPENAERDAVSRSLVAAVERRNAAARKVATLEDRLFEARRALNLAENRVNALHANAPHGTLIRFGDAWEVQGRVRHNEGVADCDLDDCTSDENCDHPTHYKGCPMQDM